MRKWLQKGRFVSLFAMLALLLMGCGDPTLSALIPQGEVADKQFQLMLISISIMILVLVVVFILYAFVLVKFRKRKGDDSLPKQVEGNHMLELLWTVIPILLLIILAVPTVMRTFEFSADAKPSSKEELSIKVTGHQYWWEFEYPKEELITSQELVLPANTKVHVELSSADVIHSFWIPSLAGKTDTNPGDKNKNYMWFDTGSKTDVVYKGKCAELCGASHALMDFKVRVVSKEDYKDWVAGFKAADGKSSANANGQQVFENNCLSCHAIGQEGGNTGPSLNGFGEKDRVAGILEHDKENLKKWIRDPQEVKPGNNMPKVKLSEEEIDAVADYLLDLKLD